MMIGAGISGAETRKYGSQFPRRDGNGKEGEHKENPNMAAPNAGEQLIVIIDTSKKVPRIMYRGQGTQPMLEKQMAINNINRLRRDQNFPRILKIVEG